MYLYFSRERRVFEKYQKAARSVPDKKEREEIESLRGQVSTDRSHTVMIEFVKTIIGQTEAKFPSNIF